MARTVDLECPFCHTRIRDYRQENEKDIPECPECGSKKMIINPFGFGGKSNIRIKVPAWH
jgi:NAD-dependent SIR2 family protein deacetylase